MKNTTEICDIARQVIEIEAAALHALSARINDEFAKACKIMLSCQGRIIVMGVGKSGHIAKKIAATLASTGTPAFFVHPGEAKHGDAGMITQTDVVLTVSYSGESEELLFIVPVLKRMHVPIIAMTGKPHSRLAQHADIHLDVSIEKEACPLGLAPTSSTTTALAMGDALAVALLQERGFTQEDFALSHPGGILGRKLLLKVDEIMHKDADLPCVNLDALLKTALLEMTQKKLGMTTVVTQNNELVGVFTDGDVRRILDTEVNIHKTKIDAVMSKNPKVILSGTLAVDALQLMKNHKITSLVVTNTERQALGVVHMHDILKHGLI